VQPKWLRFLETRRARRVGGEAEYEVKVRVVSATNSNLEAAIAQKQFRSDLYYRLAEIILQIPPLRSRVEDLPELAMIFLERANERFGKNFEALEPGLLERFQQYAWPGNVRELKSAVDRLVLLFDGAMLRAGWWEPPGSPVNAELAVPAIQNFPAPSLPGRTERQNLARKLMAEGQFSLSEIAARTGVHPTTLFRWRKAGRV
jgi:transcriptional regulator with PAS, ATPase and Fis domain